MRRRYPAAMLLLLGMAYARPALAAPELLHEGKPLTAWIERLRAKDPDKRKDALRTLGAARFLVGAPDVVLPAVEPLLSDPQCEFTALWAVADFGPLAASLEPTLAGLEDLLGSVLATRVRVGRDVGPLLEALRAKWANARERGEGRSGAAGLLWWQSPLGQARSLGWRGDAGVAFAASLRDDAALRVITAHEIGEALAEWGPLASQLSGLVPTLLANKEPVIRVRGVVSGAWMPNLPQDVEADVFRGMTGQSSGPQALRITRGVALTAAHPDAKAIPFLRTRSTSSDGAIAAWAWAGLARRVPAADRPRLVAPLTALLRHADPDARAGAADGLLTLADPATAATVAPALADADLRVRWRAAALVIRLGGDSAAALPELRRGIESPSDQDRCEAFDAVATLGPAAAALAPDLEAWAATPFPMLAGKARAALAAVRR